MNDCSLCIFLDFEIFILKEGRRKEQKREGGKSGHWQETNLFLRCPLLDGNANIRMSQERGGGIG